MAANFDFTQANALLKDVYGELSNVIPSHAIIQKDIGFETSENRLGDKFVFPVILTQEHGVTYGGTSDSFALNASVAATVGQAEASAYMTVLKTSMGLKFLASAVSAGKRAFISATEIRVKNMIDSLSKRVEASLLYGQVGWGKTTTGSANSSNTSTTLTCIVTQATFAEGLWCGMENAKFNFYNSTALVSSGADSIFVLTSVTPSTRTLVFTGTATGVAAAIDLIEEGTLDIYPYGAYGSETPGLQKIMSASSTIFNIDPSVYQLWKGRSLNVGGALSLELVGKGLASAAQSGLMDDCVIYVNPYVWNELNGDEAALRSYDSSYNKAEAVRGTQRIRYNTPSGLVEVVAHPFVKIGDAFAIAKKDWMRTGSSDISMKVPGSDDYMILDASNTLVYFLGWTDQVLFSRKPAGSVYYSGITVT